MTITQPAWIDLDADTFHDHYQPHNSPTGNQIWTTHDLTGINPHHIWTITEDETLYATPGRHTVNAIGHYVTELPWPHENIGVTLTSPYDDARDTLTGEGYDDTDVDTLIDHLEATSQPINLDQLRATLTT